MPRSAPHFLLFTVHFLQRELRSVPCGFHPDPAVAPSSDDLVFYRDTHQITHAGVVAADRIISKWGAGHLWLHRLLEVPASYGNTTSFYAGITPQDALVNFVEFARQREGRELVDYVLELEPIEWCEPPNTVLQQSDLAGR